MKKKTAKKSRLRAFVVGLAKTSCVVLLLLVVAGGGFLAWYMQGLGEIVTAKFEGKKWQIPSRIFADSMIIYPGMRLDLGQFDQRLFRLGYRSTKDLPTAMGEYRIRKKAGTAEVYLKDFQYPLRDFKGYPIRITTKSGVIKSLKRLDRKQLLSSVELEPELLTGFYDSVWEQRKVVRLDEIPALVKDTVLAVEDERFYYHRGVDPVAVARAAVVNLQKGVVVQGGSTLTQQLMKNFFLDSERKMERKVKEALMAVVAEWKYSKEEILENYLNEIYLGQNGAQGIFGVWEASKFYFSKEPSQLTPGEIAILIGLIKAPNRYSPYRNVKGATKRRNTVLAKMVKDNLIPQDAYEQAVGEVIEPRKPLRVRNGAPYFTDYLKKELADNYTQEDLTAEGLRIFTSLDMELQADAETALQTGLARLEKRYRHLRRKVKKDDLQGAIVVIKPQTGEIKAMVGGRDYQQSQFNRVAQSKRQPGSIFKPFVYIAALTYGSKATGRPYSPSTLVDDTQFTWTFDNQDWSPENYKDKYFGIVSLREALERSLNSATARVAQDVGIKRVREMAYRLGIESPLPLLPSLTLGAVEVTPLEVGNAFGTLANNGVRTNLLAIKHVVDQNGAGLERRHVRVRKVLSPQVAYLANTMLRGVLDRGSGRGARSRGFKRPAAGKTGTTNDARDAWFAGYTPDLLAVVWVGFDRQTELGLSGSEAALPIWTDFMKRATKKTPPTRFLRPPGLVEVTVDPQTGYRATPNCPKTAREYFLKSAAPKDFCPLHREGSEQVGHRDVSVRAGSVETVPQ